MISEYTLTLKNGRQIDVFIDYEEHPENLIVYMKNSPEVTVFPTLVKQANGEVAQVLTDFLEDDKNLKEFEEGKTFAMKIAKGKGMIL